MDLFGLFVYFGRYVNNHKYTVKSLATTQGPAFEFLAAPQGNKAVEKRINK